ncbi:hypothetical protein MBRA_06266 [Methylobacterium brachiatum]|nr:hypothetical protein MBRA_06266 [Methylobacterium brachiatum]
MVTQTPDIDALRRGLADFAGGPTDRPPTIKQMVHDLHDEIEAALRSRRTFAQIAEHLTNQGVKVSQSSLQLYHRERRRELAGDAAPKRTSTPRGPASDAVPAPSSASAPTGTSTSTARFKRAL